MTNNDHITNLLSEYIDGTLSPAQRLIVEQHLETCQPCAAELEALRTLVGKLHSLPRALQPPDDLLEGFEAKLTAHSLTQDSLTKRKNGAINVMDRTINTTIYRLTTSTWYGRIAAMLIALIGIAILWFALRTSTNNPTGEARFVQNGGQSNGAVVTPESSGTAIGKSEEQIQSQQPVIHKTKQTPVVKEQTFARVENQKQDTSQTAGISASKNLSEVTSVDTTKDQKASGSKAVTLAQDTASINTRPMTGKGTQGKIVGRVTDEKGEGAIGVNVLVVGTQRGAPTDLDGKFTIIGVPVGTYTIRASGTGYQTAETTGVRVSANQTTTLTINTASVIVNMQGMVTLAQKEVINNQSTSSSTTIGTQKIEPVPNATSVQDVVRLGAGGAIGGKYSRHQVRAGEHQYVVDGVPVNGMVGNAGDLTGAKPNSWSYGDFNREGYDRIYENEFKDAFSNPLSTFSIDVDAASYSNIRRFINDGQLPPPDAVRIEEMINYFSYNYEGPKGDVPFSISTEVAECPWNHSDKLLMIGLQGKRIATENLPPSNLVFLLDVSGSMYEPDKLPLVKAAFRLLVQQLREQDRVSIVVYAGNTGLALPATSGSDKQTILNAIDRLEAGGSTAGGAGITLAYKVAKENFMPHGNNRVILATDGDFNVGVTSDADLTRLIEEKRDDGIYLSVLGFGTGNLQDAKMEQLADKGNGNHSYVDNILEAKKVFVSQMAGTLFTIAKDVKIQIEFNPAKVKSYRLIGYENRMLAKEDFNNDKKDAGELGAGHTVTALYEIVPGAGSVELPAVDSLKYQHMAVKSDAFGTDELLTVKLRYKMPSDTTSQLLTHPVSDQNETADEASNNFKFASAVAQFGMLMRDSKFKGDATYNQVLEEARKAKGEDMEGYRAEFIQLVEKAILMQKQDQK